MVRRLALVALFVATGAHAQPSGNTPLTRGLADALYLKVASVAAVVSGGTGQSTYTKGDLLASPGGATLNKLAIGPDGWVLTADAASANGMKWAAGSGGANAALSNLVSVQINADLVPGSDNSRAVGSAITAFASVYSNFFRFGTTGNSASYSDTVGPRWFDNATGFTLTQNVQSLSVSRAVIWPDLAGTVALTSGAQTFTNKTFTTPIFTAVAFASLGAPANGTFNYCNDCTIANPCASGGTGALAKRLNGTWVCN